ncbi:hypothetical protein, partial [Corynebacterium belfantii]|uniref:hypothetical protein n=1 Tax=Corynebacterium belfantii TaxID=2014537 RepID=UPI001A7EB306
DYVNPCSGAWVWVWGVGVFVVMDSWTWIRQHENTNRAMIPRSRDAALLLPDYCTGEQAGTAGERINKPQHRQLKLSTWRR